MKKILLSLLALTTLLLATSLVSATLCQNYKGYYEDCTNYNTYNSYGNYNTVDRASTPIFKGSYGNYRYIKYENGDTNPPRYFVSSGLGYNPYPTFGGGYGGYLGYSNYGRYGSYNTYPFYGGYRGYGGYYSGFGYSNYRYNSYPLFFSSFYY